MKLRLPAAAVIAGVAGAVALRTVHGVASRSSQLFGPSVYRGDGSRRSIALTFDDGPSDGSLQLIDYLAAEGIPATFFQCGKNVERHPEIARRIHERGHEIGNHTYSHPRLAPRIAWQAQFRSPAFIEAELSRTQRIIETEVGLRPHLMRAPYGLRWYGLAAAQEKLRLLGVMWTVIGRDWEWPAYAIADLVLRRSTPGGIICLHDGRDIQPKPDISEMLKALRRIVAELKDAGYAFETVSSLIGPLRSESPVLPPHPALS